MVEGDIIGFVASALVLATFAMKDMRRLRLTAVLSNVAFIAYGLFCSLMPVLVLHLLLLPLNVFRLREERRTAPLVSHAIAPTRPRSSRAWGLALAAGTAIAVGLTGIWFLSDARPLIAISMTAQNEIEPAVSDTPFEETPRSFSMTAEHLPRPLPDARLVGRAPAKAQSAPQP
jgi:hypothetical protein